MATGKGRFGWLAVLLAVLWAVSLEAQGRGGWEPGDAGEGVAAAELKASSPGAPLTADAVLEAMSEAAGVIFAGQVVAVRGPAGVAGSSEDATEGVVEVDFRVDQGVRGPASGSLYTLREWAGLWNGNGNANGNGSGGGRYRVGQRLLVFFYEPDAHGLSSPVRGRDGAVPLRGGGVAPGPDDTTASAAEWMVDLRWVQAQAFRREALVVLPVRRPAPPGHGGFAPEEADERGELASTLARGVRRPVQLPALGPTAVETEPLTQVLALCVRAMRRVDVAR